MKNAKSVFISYSSKDVKQVESVIKVLKEAGIDYWKAPEMIPVGSNYAKEIPKVICECIVFVLIITEQSQESIWVEKEVDYAINNKKTIVPIKMFDGELSGMFKFYLNNVQMINYNEEGERAFYILKERILNLISTERERKISLFKEDKKTVKSRDGGRLNVNPQPEECKYCGGELINVSVGKYKCRDCKNMNYDYFHTVRNYLDLVGTASIITIEKDTGVPRTSIEYFLKNELLEIPKNCKIRIVCEGCGAPIRTGRICEHCKSRGIRTSHDSKNDKYTMLKKKD